jgi:hypothetical protein
MECNGVSFERWQHGRSVRELDHFPELIDRMPKFCRAKNFVLEREKNGASEAVRAEMDWIQNVY